jgi:protocatechuate 3,4-dioxygenase beta subunit
MRKRWLAALVVLGFAKTASAQTVRGTVVGDGDRPVRGVVVILVDPASKEVGRSLTDEGGEYRLVAPRPGTYRVRTLRIGFRSLLTEPIALAAGDDLTRRLAVSTVVFSLDTVRAVGRNTCKVIAGDSTSVVGATWDQVRSALIATQLSFATRAVYSTGITYERTQDVHSQRIGHQTLDMKVGYVAQPWRSLPAATLRKSGYVYSLPDSSRVYNAPDLAVLLSDEFIEDHCLRVARNSTDGRLGIDFTPTPARRDTPEIRGTLWLDRKSNELVELEYGYINRIRQDEERLAGGTIAFTHMKNGMWAISRWTIRMPVLSLRKVLSPSFAVVGHEIRLDSVKTAGGELVLVTTTGMRRDTIWMRPTLALRGTVLDSTSGAPVAGAIVNLSGTVQVDTTDAQGDFNLPSVLPGRYALNVTTPSLDSINTVDQRTVFFTDSSTSLTVRVPNARMIAGTICEQKNTATRLGAGILLGSVVRGRDSLPVANANVSVQWTEIELTPAVAGSRTREAVTRTNAKGDFRICGLPTATTFDVSARSDSGQTSVLRVPFDREQLFARADLVIDRERIRTGTFTGTVVDSAGTPLPDADVRLSDLGLSSSTAANGTFSIAGVAPGNHGVTVRKVGYGPMDAKIDFAAGKSSDRRIVLTHITLLDTVVSTGKDRDPLMEKFEERRRLGLGHFVTKDEIVKREGMLLTSFLRQTPGLNVVGENFIEGKRATASSCTSGNPVPRRVQRESSLGRCLMREGIYYVPVAGDPTTIVGCYSRVFLDNQPMNPGQPSPPVNLRDLPAPTSIEAIEWYASPAQMPPEFIARNSSCGVLVIHIRRPK